MCGCQIKSQSFCHNGVKITLKKSRQGKSRSSQVDMGALKTSRSCQVDMAALKTSGVSQHKLVYVKNKYYSLIIQSKKQWRHETPHENISTR